MLNAPLFTLGFANTGWVGCSTVTANVWMALRLGNPLSLTFTITESTFDDCVMPGRQVIKPLVALMVTPLGAPTRLKVSDCGGASGSTTLLLTIMVAPAMMVRFEMGASTGAVFGPASAAICEGFNTVSYNRISSI